MYFGARPFGGAHFFVDKKILGKPDWIFMLFSFPDFFLAVCVCADGQTPAGGPVLFSSGALFYVLRGKSRKKRIMLFCLGILSVLLVFCLNHRRPLFAVFCHGRRL